MRVWIDTDVGSDVDDALAIAHVMRHPALELVGVSTVFGDVVLRSRIARRLLELGGHAHVPVETGLGRPLSEARIGRMFGHEGRGLVDDPQPRAKTLENVDVEATLDRIADALAVARPDVMVSIGPMTNLGALARHGQALPPLAIMGGHVDRAKTWPDQIAGIPEWNWWCDPDAVGAALANAHENAERPPRIVPGEVTFQTELAREDLDRLARGDALSRVLAELSEQWLVAQRNLLGAKTPCVRLHDPLTTAILVEPALAPAREQRIRVDVDGVTHTAEDGIRFDVAHDVDLDGLRHHLLSTWLGPATSAAARVLA